MILANIFFTGVKILVSINRLSQVCSNRSGLEFADSTGKGDHMGQNWRRGIFSISTILILLSYNSCGEVTFQRAAALPSAVNSLDEPADPPPPPLVHTYGVVTILLALGDQINDQLMINGGSSQIIAETAVRYASPVQNPRILVVRDGGHNNETYYDSEFVAKTLLMKYDTDFIDEPLKGLQTSDLVGYDIIWFNNPGYPMSKAATLHTLLEFQGGVILSGDDMSWGQGFLTEELSGLKHVNNGTSVRCADENYYHDDNKGYQYKVSLLQDKLPDIDVNMLKFSYGNDIDLTQPHDRVEIIAEAVGGHSSCTETRPVIARYEREFTN